MKTETSHLACTHCGRVGMGQGEWNAPTYRCTHADFAARYPAASEVELAVLWNDKTLSMVAYRLICPLTKDCDAATMDAIQVLREARDRMLADLPEWYQGVTR